MNTNIATKKIRNKKIGVASYILEGKNSLNMANVFTEGVTFKKNKKTDNFNENYILDLIRINLETNKLLKEFVFKNYSGTKAELEKKLQEFYFSFEKKKVFKFSENLTDDIKKEFNPLNFDKILDEFNDYIFNNLEKYKYFYFFFGRLLAQPSSLKSGTSPLSLKSLPLIRLRQSVSFPVSC